jgi:hypothetical protein
MPPTLPQIANGRRFATIGPHRDPAWHQSHPPHERKADLMGLILLILVILLLFGGGGFYWH